MPVTRLVAPGPARAQADADPAAGAGVAVGRMGGALLVADEDVAQLRVVVPDVVERQDHAARVAEDDVHALADERLAEGVGADAGALEDAPLVEHVAAGACSTGGRLGGRRRPGTWLRRFAFGRTGRAALRRVSWSSPLLLVVMPSPSSAVRISTKNPRLPARVPWCFGWSRALALVPPPSPFSRREPVIRPRSPARPSPRERRRPRSDTSDRPLSWTGTCTRRPSLRHGDRDVATTPPLNRPNATVRFVRRRLAPRR